MKSLLKSSLVLMAAAFLFAGCNCYKKMAKHMDDVQITCNPEVLTLNNGKIVTDVTANIPAKYFNKNAVLKVTPVLVYNGGELVGTPKFYQGSKVNENYTVIDKKKGGTFTQHVEFPYSEELKECELQLRLEGSCPNNDCKCKDLTMFNANTGAMPTEAQAALLAADNAEGRALRKEFGLTVAYGVNTLQQDLNYSEVMVPMANNYKRVTTEEYVVDLLYKINDSKVQKDADASLNNFKGDVDAKSANDRATQHISVQGYASPDGPETFNDKLSKARSESGKAAVVKLLEGTGLEVDAAAYGEDWNGLKELVENSNIKDKNLILQVLSLYSSSSQRESEIKNMSSVYSELKTDVLPKLRRSKVVNSTDVQGKTDDEMMALINSKNFGQLNSEELLFAAENLVKNPAQKVEVLDYTAKKYNDVRAYNNLGIALSQNGDHAASLQAFEKAAKLGSNDAALTNNLAIANLANGKADEAAKYVQAADQKTKAFAAAAQGNYSEAAKNLSGTNAAIAYVMNKDYAAAKNAIAQDNSAEADYLRAVIANKEGDLATAKAQLNSAVAKNPELAKKAAKDVNLKGIAE